MKVKYNKIMKFSKKLVKFEHKISFTKKFFINIISVINAIK